MSTSGRRGSEDGHGFFGRSIKGRGIAAGADRVPLGVRCGDRISAHGIGIWYHKQIKGKDKSTFRTEALFPKLVSQTHALVMADINGDMLNDFVTGKRWWAHGPGGDVEPNAPAKVFWFETKKARDGSLSFTPHEIDDDSGIGTQFYVGDVNGDGLPDVVTSNKKGTFLFEQVR